MEIHQLLPGFQYGDAISNHAVALRRMLRSWGYRSEIYARYVGPKVAHQCFPLRDFRPFAPALVIYHYSIGADEVTNLFLNCPAKRVLIYHNITPHRFFASYDQREYEVLKSGRELLPELAHSVDLALADSPYNCGELRESGCRDPRVLPILLDLERLDNTCPCPRTLNRYRDDWKNFLFVGRLVANKRPDDVIRGFAHYNAFLDRRSRLFLVGNRTEGEEYFCELKQLVRALKVEDHVVFAGHVRLRELVAFYKLAHLFLCMSEHEGFGVPFLEAFHYGVPTIAFNAAAVPTTLDDAGVLVNKKNYALIAEMANLLLSDADLRQAVVDRQRRRLGDFEPAQIAKRFKAYIEEVLAA
jgi:glycosyltransferase involved in cell wall biosynthesis